jgi:hypothetical protein
MIELLVTENKSWDPVRFYRNRVRVFLAKNYNYGVWVDEDFLFEVLDLEQKKVYLTEHSPSGNKFQVTPEIAKKVLNKGHSPYHKQDILSSIQHFSK